MGAVTSRATIANGKVTMPSSGSGFINRIESTTEGSGTINIITPTEYPPGFALPYEEYFNKSYDIAFDYVIQRINQTSLNVDIFIYIATRKEETKVKISTNILVGRTTLLLNIPTVTALGSIVRFPPNEQ